MYDVARAFNRLSARTVSTLKTPGRHADGGGLYLNIAADGSRRRWVFRSDGGYPGRPGRESSGKWGWGVRVPSVFAKARELATQARNLLVDGRNPLETREVERAIPTFGAMADEVVASLRNWLAQSKTPRSVANDIARVLPTGPRNIGERNHDRPCPRYSEAIVAEGAQSPSPVYAVGSRKYSMRRRPKGIGQVENPARWRGHLDHLLPAPETHCVDTTRRSRTMRCRSLSDVCKCSVPSVPNASSSPF